MAAKGGGHVEESKKKKNHGGYSFTLIEINTTVIILLAQSAQRASRCVLFHRLCRQSVIIKWRRLDSRGVSRDKTRTQRGWWWCSVYAKSTRPAIHASFVSGCYETPASSMAVVFTTRAAEDGSGYKQPREEVDQVQRSQEVDICQETRGTGRPCVTEYHFFLTFSLGQPLLWRGRSALARTPGPGAPNGVKRNWVTCTCLSVYICILLMLPTPSTTQGKVTPSPLDPPSFFCVFALPSPPRCHREHPCSSSRLLSTGTSQKSQISLQFPVQCLFGGKRAGGRATMKKEPHSQTVWAAFEGKHVQEGYVRRAVRQTEARVFWSWHTDPTSAGTQSTALFRPQPPQSNKHPPRHLLSVPGTAPSGGELRTRCRKTDHTAPEINIRLNSVITLGFFMHHSQKQDGCNTINISTKVVPNLCRLLPHPFINTTHHVLDVFF